MKTFYLKRFYSTLSFSLILYCFIVNAQTTTKNGYNNNKINPKTGNAFPYNIIDSIDVVPAPPVNTPIIPYVPSPPDPAPPPHTGNNPVHSLNGNYLALTNSNGKSSGGEPSGIENVLQTTDLKIYPNPNDGRFSLQFNLNTEGEIIIRVTDIVGKEIISYKHEGYSSNYIDQFDLSDKGKGLYILSIEQNNKQLAKKIIVN